MNLRTWYLANDFGGSLMLWRCVRVGYRRSCPAGRWSSPSTCRRRPSSAGATQASRPSRGPRASPRDPRTRSRRSAKATKPPRRPEPPPPPLRTTRCTPLEQFLYEIRAVVLWQYPVKPKRSSPHSGWIASPSLEWRQHVESRDSWYL